MKLDKENTKQIIKIIIVAIVLLAVVLNLSTVWNGIKVFLNIISPFIWGLAIAFVLNIFMTFYENIVFKSRNKNSNKRVKADDKKTGKKKRHKRTLSIILSIITIVAIIAIIMVLVVPEFYEVIKNLISNIPNYLVALKYFAIETT